MVSGPGLLSLGVLARGHDVSGLKLFRNCEGLNGSCLMGVEGVVSPACACWPITR